MEDIKILLGNRIRFLRTQMDLSQEELALKAGLDRTYVTSIENGKRNVSIVNIERLATALEHSLSDFFDAKEFHRLPTYTTLSKVAEKGAKRYK